MGKTKSDYLVDHVKMDVLRSVAKKFPDGVVAYVLKTIDNEFDIQIERIRKNMESKKQPAFITKF